MCYICRLIRSLKTIMVLKTTLLAMILVYSFWTDTTLAGSSFLSPEQPRTQVSISGYYFAAITLFQVYPTHSLLLTKHSYLALICFLATKTSAKTYTKGTPAWCRSISRYPWNWGRHQWHRNKGNFSLFYSSYYTNWCFIGMFFQSTNFQLHH